MTGATDGIVLNVSRICSGVDEDSSIRRPSFLHSGAMARSTRARTSQGNEVCSMAKQSSRSGVDRRDEDPLADKAVGETLAATALLVIRIKNEDNRGEERRPGL